MPCSIPGAYVRFAEPHEYSEVASVLAHGFARDPCMNWFGGVKNLGLVPAFEDEPDYEAHTAAAKRTLDNLLVFQRAVPKATVLSGGFILVAVIPKEQRIGKASTEESSGETIAGVSLWLRPGQLMKLPLTTIVRSGVWKVLHRWGLVGVKRVVIDLSSAVERSLHKGFKARNMDRLDSWHLLAVTVDPPYQGKDGFERTSPKPVHLEATTYKSLHIYSHYGFEVDEEHCFGKGKVDSNGLSVKQGAATGYPEWIMTKWTYDQWTYDKGNNIT